MKKEEIQNILRQNIVFTPKISKESFVMANRYEYGDYSICMFDDLEYKSDKVYYNKSVIGISKEEVEQLKEGKLFYIKEHGGNTTYSPLIINMGEKRSDDYYSGYRKCISDLMQLLYD